MIEASLLVVDTDVVSFIAKGHPLTNYYRQHLEGKSLAVSVITVAEIEHGMELRNWGDSRRTLLRKLLQGFTPISPDSYTATLWAEVRVQSERKRRPIGISDAWIAATALQLNVPLVTHNARDYAAIDDLAVITAS